MAISLASAALMASSAPLVVAVDVPAVMQTAQQAADQAAEDTQPVEPPAEEQALPVESDSSEPRQPSGNVIVVTGDSETRQKDPLVNLNETTFKLTQDVDQALVKPIAGAYEEELPSPVRKGLRNFFRNLMEPVNALNYLLQLKPGKAFETLGRFAINTTVGVGGLVDVAKKKPFNLPYRRNGFGNTLGYYGVGPGPFLVVPLIGATSLRDLLGTGVDQSILPFAIGKPFNTPYYAIPAFTVNSLEYRIEFDERLEQIANSDDPYFAMRESYLCLREADIAALKNRPPPRDCSIDALLGIDAPEVTPPGEPAPVEAEVIEPEIEPAPPAIIYVSEEVVQPLPEA
jgi:phospholipid-binding lipoprotein MlaA